ncbi:MAG TPA: hypothetical protein VEI55_03675 [Candidatus Acidoferrum sp.]|nr:hypothetical protein [Candidatus Acidoferrum sp.]
MKLRNTLMRTGRLLALAVLPSLYSTAWAQDSAPPPPPPGPDVFYRTGRGIPGPGVGDDTVVFVGIEEGIGGKTVTGAPFSAGFSTETKQVLADGNQILRSSAGTVARDSQGRTRRDMTLPGIGLLAGSNQAPPHVVMINDPVAGSQYVLEVDQKVARKMQMRHGGKYGPDQTGNAPEFTVRAADQSHVTTASLGTQTINGVLAEGTRTTRIIPAGAIGNTNPIVITVERWYSADLQTVVMMKRSDPRMGETTFQLTNIQRQEPDPSLFQVPADYTVKQGRGGRFARTVPPAPDGGPAELPRSPKN